MGSIFARPLSSLAALASLAAACSGGGDGGPTPPDAGDESDAATQCANPVVDFDLGDLGSSLEFRAKLTPQETPGAVYLDIFAQLQTGPVIDLVDVLLFDGFGAFAGGITPGTYEISGPETDFYSCGACMLVVGDFNQTTMQSAQRLVASSGTLTLEMVSTKVGDTVSGTLENADFRQVELDDANMVQTETAGGCTTHIDSVSFEAMVE